MVLALDSTAFAEGVADDAALTAEVQAVPGLPAADVTLPGSYRTLPATRVVDTRLTGARLAPGERLVVPLRGRYGVPASGVGAVQLHVTVVAATGRAHVTVHPSDTSAGATSSVNYDGAIPVANSVTTRLGADGAVIVSNAGGSTDVVVDLSGWFAEASAADPGYHASTPARLWDSRVAGTRVSTTGTAVTVVGGAVPTAATAVMLNVTTVDASASGPPLSAWATGATRPTTSISNLIEGDAAVAAQALVPVGSGGRISLGTTSSSTNVVVDVLGYVLGSAPTQGQVATVSPARLADTRVSGGAVGSGGSRVTKVRGIAGVPTTATAAVLTITAVPTAGAEGTLVAMGHGDDRPPTSAVNARDDVPVAQQVIVPIGVDGAVEVLRVGGSGHHVVDVVGYVTAIPRPVVVPPSPALLAAGIPTGPLTANAREVLSSSVRYGLNTWWTDARLAPKLLAAPMDAKAQKDPEDSIRRLAMEALGISTAIATGAYPTGQTMTTAEAQAVVAKIITRVACRHRASVIGGWGHDWQSTLWSSIAARAAWLSWTSLTGSTQSCVQAMVQSEADWATTVPVERQVAGNTGAEENSWQALAPGVAVAMMPAAERRDAWRASQVRLLAGSWVRAADLAANPLVDGYRLTTLAKGLNVEDNGTVMNHERVAPDYSTNVYQNIDARLMAALAGHAPPQAAMVGLNAVYVALGVNRYSTAQGFAAPGGTVYGAKAPQLYYPQGSDWYEGQQLPFALLDAQASTYAFGGPTGGVMDPAPWAGRHLAEAVKMQRRSATGAMYQATWDGAHFTSTEYRYFGREEHTAQLAAQLVLTLVLGPTGG